jgi:hypothetical protein
VLEHRQKLDALDELVIRPTALEVLLPIEVGILWTAECEVIGEETLDESPVVVLVG